MGLFTKKKTSADYLKEIAESQKTQAEISKAEARAIKATSQLERDAYEDEMYERRKANEILEFNNKKEQLQVFYDSFNFDMFNTKDIIQKSMAMISWIDTVDTKSKGKASYNSYTGEKLEDDNCSKRIFLIRKLKLAIERLEELDVDKKTLKYIQNKLESYEHSINIEKKHKKELRIKSVKYILICIVICTIVGTCIYNIPNPTKNGADCKAKVLKLLDNGDIDNAYKCILAFEGYDGNDNFRSAKEILSDTFLKEGKLDDAISLKVNKAHIVEYLIENASYDDAYKQCISQEYDYGYYYEKDLFYKNSIAHMCKNEKYNEAKLFVKKYSLEYEDLTERNKFVRKMNEIINLYQSK